MLRRHLLGTSARIGVGANRAATAARFLERYGYTDTHIGSCLKRCCSNQTTGSSLESDKIGAAILDDGMQVNKVSSFLLIVTVVTRDASFVHSGTISS